MVPGQRLSVLWCGTLWPEAHAARMIAHLLQQTGMYMKPCLGKIDEEVKKSTKTSLIERIPKKLKKGFIKTQLSQYKTCKPPWPKHWWP